MSWGYGEIGGQTTLASTTPATATTYFSWGWGDPDPSSLFSAAGGGTWTVEEDWGYGDPATLESDHVLWAGTSTLPDDGGEIVEVQADWPEIGPWRITCVQSFTTQTFPEATAPLPYCSSPVPGYADRCYTDTVEVEELGSMVTKPGTSLRFVIPILPPGVYDVKIELPPPALLGSEIVLEKVFTVVWRNRGVETYTYRRRFPGNYSLGVRNIAVEPLLGVHADADEDE